VSGAHTLMKTIVTMIMNTSGGNNRRIRAA
jgi:hypothetical protein